MELTARLATRSPVAVTVLGVAVALLGCLTRIWGTGHLVKNKVLATGGVYLGGGMPPRILSALDDGRFMAAFQNKGRLADLLGRIPVHVILNPKAALLGAACYGLDV